MGATLNTTLNYQCPGPKDADCDHEFEDIEISIYVGNNHHGDDPSEQEILASDKELTCPLCGTNSYDAAWDAGEQIDPYDYLD